MKKLISIILLLSMLPSLAFADCDWKTIQKTPQGQYLFSETLYLCVGQLVEDNKTKDAQIADYKAAIQLKDLAITQSDNRVASWEKIADSEQERMNKIDSQQDHNNFIYFGLGILATIGTGFAVAKLSSH